MRVENNTPKNLSTIKQEFNEFKELRKIAEEKLDLFLMKDLTFWHVYFYNVKKGEEHWYVTQVQLGFVLERPFIPFYSTKGFEVFLSYFFIEGQMYVYFSIGTKKGENDLLEFKKDALRHLRNYFYMELIKK